MSVTLERRAEAEIDDCLLSLLTREPFFGHLLCGVARLVGEMVPTAAVGFVDAAMRLWVNPTFFLKTLTKRADRIALLKHEVLHLAFSHPLLRRAEHDAFLFNIAADLVVNQHLAPWPTPAGAITLETFPDLPLEPKQSVFWYYNALSRVTAASSPGTAAKLAKLREGMSGSDHPTWEPLADLPEVVRELVAAEIARRVEQAMERLTEAQRGQLPGHLLSEIDARLATLAPRVDWRRVVRLFGERCRTSAVKPTRQRPSRRFEAVAGMAEPSGIRRRRKSDLVVILDTSGSLPASALASLFAEVRGLWRSGATVTVVECDCAVQSAWVYTGETPQHARGRGGTSFDPALQWLRDQHPRRFDGAIYFTDGHAVTPVVRPPCPMLWVITPHGTTENVGPGRVLPLPEARSSS